MNLRLDHLLETLRSRGPEILAAIDADPLLVRRQAGPLVLANAGPALFTPQEEHQLFAKGIVYRRDPFGVVSLPLVKIYNLGETSVSAADLAGLAAEGPSRLHFLRKFDGTLIQRFQFDGRVYFTTRGMIEGGPAAGVQDRVGEAGEPPTGSPESPPDDAPERAQGFDFLGAARRVAGRFYPGLCEPRPELDGLTLVFEFLHPETRVITDYGDRQDLVLLACFDRRDWRYRTYREVRELAAEHGLTPVDEFTPAGATLGEQIDSLLASVAGTDQEGTVITIEHGHRVVYRVKVKSPDYVRVLKLVVTCTYARTAEMLDANPGLTCWAEFEAHLRGLGRESVPEEVLGFYREHHETHTRYRDDCERLRLWGQETADRILAEARAEAGNPPVPRLLRKCFASRAVKYPLKALLFAAFDGRLDAATVREVARTPDEAKQAVEMIRG